MIKNYQRLIAIRASEKAKLENPQWINVLNVGHWDTNYQGSFTVSKEDLQEMVNNFNSNVRKGVPIDTNHDNGEANGWITELQTRENGEQLWALCEWTSIGEEKISNKIFKFLSPEFAPQYVDPETNQLIANNVLIAAALTNFPLMKGLKAVVASESKDELIIEDSTMEKEKEAIATEEVVEASEVVETSEVKEEVKEEIKEAEVVTPVEEEKPAEVIVEASEGEIVGSVVEPVVELVAEPVVEEVKIEVPVEEVKVEVVEEVVEEKVEEKVEEPAEPVAEPVIEAAEKKPKVEEEMTDDDVSPAKRVKDKKAQKDKLKEEKKKEEKEACDKQAEAVVETVKAEEDSMEQEVNEIADAFEDSPANIFKNQWYGYKIVGTYEDSAGAGHIILIADPDCDATDWSDLAHVKYYRVDFTEDEATEEYTFQLPVLVEVEFVPSTEESEIAVSYNIMMTENKNKKAEEAPVEVPAEEKIEVSEVKIEEKEQIMAKEVKTAEFTEEALRDMEKKGITKIKCADGEVKEIKDGQIVESEVIEEKEEVKEDAGEPVGEIVAVEGEKITISASEYDEFKKAKEELVTKQASETISSLVFNEKDGLKMPALMKESLVAFYLKLNEGMKQEFTQILEKIPAAKIFSEIGDAGSSETSSQGAYEAIGKRAEEIKASEPHLNYGQAVIKARKENPELAKLADELRKKN